MPLTLADPGTVYTIERITGKDVLRRRLMTLGVVEQEKIAVKQSAKGNVIAEVKGIRLALDADLARRIMVKVCV